MNSKVAFIIGSVVGVGIGVAVHTHILKISTRSSQRKTSIQEEYLMRIKKTNQ